MFIGLSPDFPKIVCNFVFIGSSPGLNTHSSVKNTAPKKWDEKGCSDKCDNFHPNGCRDSLEMGKCLRDDCRFFHLKNTVRNDPNSKFNRTKFNSHQTQKTFKNDAVRVWNKAPESIANSEKLYVGVGLLGYPVHNKSY